MKKELHINAFEHGEDQKCILENAKHLYLDDVQLVEHYSILHMRHQLFSTSYGLGAEQDLIYRKFDQYKNECRNFDKIDYHKSYIPIKTLNSETIMPETISNLLHDPCAPPIIIKGYLNSSEAVRKWDHRYFIENYGDVSIPVMDYTKANNSDKDIGFGNTKVLLAKDILEAQLNKNAKEAYYINNSIDFFVNDPNLLEQTDLPKIAKLLEGIAHPLYGQMFIGNLKTWGTDWHMNNDISAAVLINGVKRWYFLDPLHAYALHLIPQTGTPTALLSHAFIGGDTSIRYNLEYHLAHNPVYAYAPKYYYDQKPGDVIIFPKWWPHAIINKSSLSIMVNLRFSEINFETNQKSYNTQLRMPMYESILKSDPRYREYAFEIYQRLIKGENVDDSVYFKKG